MSDGNLGRRKRHLCIVMAIKATRQSYLALREYGHPGMLIPPLSALRTGLRAGIMCHRGLYEYGRSIPVMPGQRIGASLIVPVVLLGGRGRVNLKVSVSEDRRGE